MNKWTSDCQGCRLLVVLDAPAVKLESNQERKTERRDGVRNQPRKMAGKIPRSGGSGCGSRDPCSFRLITPPPPSLPANGAGRHARRAVIVASFPCACEPQPQTRQNAAYAATQSSSDRLLSVFTVPKITKLLTHPPHRLPSCGRMSCTVQPIYVQDASDRHSTRALPQASLTPNRA